MSRTRTKLPAGAGGKNRTIEQEPRGGNGGKRKTLLILVLILLVGAGLRGIYLAEAVHHPDFTVPQVDGDFHNYWARGLAFGDWTLRGGNPDPQIRTTPFFRPPGYPYFLALLYKLTGPGYLWPRIVQMLIGLMNAALAFFLARRFFGATVALILAAFMSTYWVFIYFEGEFQEPAVFTTALLGLILVLMRWHGDGQIRTAFLAGILTGLIGLFRPNALLLVPVAGLWCFWILHRRGKLPRAPVTGAALLIGAALVVLPATFRNLGVADDPVLVSSNGGINLYIGNNQTAEGLVYANTDVGVLDTCYDWPEIVANVEKKFGRRMKHSEVSRYFTREALRYITDHPLRFLTLSGRKTLLFWGPSEPADNKEVHAERAFAPVLRYNPWNFGIALALGLAGAILYYVRLRREGTGSRGEPHRPHGQRDLVLLLVLIVVVWYLSFLPFAMTSRYRVPIIPILLLFGAIFVDRVVRFARAGDLRGTFLWLGVAGAIALPAEVNLAGYKPSFARWHYQRGLCYTTLGRRDQAIREFRDALRVNPNYVAVYNDLGAALALQGNLPESAANFVEALKRNPNHAIAHCNLAAVLEAQGRFEESLSEFKRALMIKPGYRRAEEGIRRVTGAQGKRSDPTLP